MNNGKINAKLKILIIAFYTIVIFSLVLLLFGGQKVTRFEDYGTISYDEYISVNVRESENRKSKLSTGTKEELGKHEKSTYDFYVTVVKLKVYTTITNMNFYVSARTVNDNFCYDESLNKEISTYSYTAPSAFSSFATKSFEECTEEGNTEEYLIDETPEEYFIKVTYDVKLGTGETYSKSLEYRVSALDVKLEKKLKDVEFREIDTNNANFVKVGSEPFSIKFTKSLTEETSSLQNIKNDRIRVEFKANTANLHKTQLKENYKETIELPSLINEDKTNIYPEITEIKLEVYGKINSSDENFSKYVKMYSLYGFLSQYRAPALLTYSVDESFNLSEIYVIAEGKLYNSTEDSFSVVFAVKVETLAEML